MTVIPIKNGTTSITIECGPFATLMYDNEDDVYNCIYSDWEYGILAVIAFMGILIPLALIIYCGVKCHNKIKLTRIYPSYSRQSSQSSLYPSSSRDVQSIENDEIERMLGARNRNKKKDSKYQKLYYPYAAYGTYDRSSLVPSVGDSLASLNRRPPEVAIAAPSYVPDTSIARSNRDVANYLSNSAPVIDSMLRDYRENLKATNSRHDLPNFHQYRSVKSVDSIASHSSQSLLNNIRGIGKTENSLKSKPSRPSFTVSSPSASSDDSLLYPEEKNKPSPSKKFINRAEALKNENAANSQNPFSDKRRKDPPVLGGEGSSFTPVVSKTTPKNIPSDIPNIDENDKEQLNSNIKKQDIKIDNNEDMFKQNSIQENVPKYDGAISATENPDKIDNRPEMERKMSFESVSSKKSGFSDVEKNRIIAATPTKHMKTRQDFDGFLVESVLKLPEDQRNGTFLIRDSSSTENCKVLTLYYKSHDNNGTLFYYKIFTTEHGVHLESESKIYSSLDELILNQKNQVSTLPCLLGDCLGKHF